MKRSCLVNVIGCTNENDKSTTPEDILMYTKINIIPDPSKGVGVIVNHERFNGQEVYMWNVEFINEDDSIEYEEKQSALDEHDINKALNM